MVSIVALFIGGVFIGAGVTMLRFRQGKVKVPDTWLWVGSGDDPFKRE
jgi:hypothetical protein